MIQWLKRRWSEFRQGYQYLSWPLTLISFITVVYTLLVIRLLDNFPILGILFPTVLEFAIFCGLLIPASAVIIGHYHIKKQVMTDQILQVQANKYIVEQAKAWFALTYQLGSPTAVKFFEKSLSYIGIDTDEIKRMVDEDYADPEEFTKEILDMESE